MVPAVGHNLLDIGTAWGDLRDEMPKIMRAEAMARAKIACEPSTKEELL